MPSGIVWHHIPISEALCLVDENLFLGFRQIIPGTMRENQVVGER